MQRPKADLPRGFRDYFGNEAVARWRILDKASTVCSRRGFSPLETSAIEDLSALGKFLPDLERPNKGVFAWKEDKGWLALRYDLTAPLARVVAQYGDRLPSPYRRYAMGPVWRNEKPGPGRFRQFFQFDADTVGSSNPAADAEICALAAELLEAAGIAPDKFQIRINSRKILDAVLDQAKIPAADERDTRGIVLRAIDKLDRLGLAGVRNLLADGRMDDSGDFTKGAGLSKGQCDLVLEFLACGQSSNFSTLSELRKLTMDLGNEAVDEIEHIIELLEAQGVTNERARVDTTVVRGLGYYTGAVFEAVMIGSHGNSDEPKGNLGSIAGGGRYDGLVKRFTGREVPATGVSIGVDRILAVLAAQGSESADISGPVLVTVMDAERMTDYQAMAADLRSGGISAEVYLGSARNFGRQMKYADRRGSPVAVIQGTDEHARKSVQIKNLVLGRKISATASHDEWKTKPAQREVPRDRLVAEVARTLSTLHDQ